MTKHEIQKSLIAYGLTHREAITYISLIELLDGSVTDIAKKATLPRSTIQAVLAKLHDKGFVETFHKNGVLHYTPASLNKLVTDLKEKEDIIQQTLPSLQQLVDSSKQGNSLHVAYGIAGIKAAFTDLLDLYRGGLQHVYAVSNTSKLLELLPKFFPEWAQKESVHPVNVQMLIPDGAHIHKNTAANARMTVKKVPKQYAFPGDMTIAGSTVFFFHLEKQNPHVYIIHSAEVANIQTTIFKLLWELNANKNNEK